MTSAKTKAACSPVPLDPLVERMCGTCKNWHKRDNYACKFNGHYGGGTDGVEGCKWKPKTPNVELRGPKAALSPKAPSRAQG